MKIRSWISLNGFKKAYSRIIHIGVDETTPSHLVDRVVYSNIVCLYGGFITFLAAMSTRLDHVFLFYLHGIYILGILSCFFLNWLHWYLAARRTVLFLIFASLTLGSVAQGNGAHIEHFFLAFGILAYSMFHPSERGSAIFFALLSVILFFVFVNRTEPIWDIDPFRAQFGVPGLRINQVLYLLLYFASLIGLSNAYARAIKVVDIQREQIFEQNRLSTVGAMAANMAHEINTPLSALDMQAHILLENLESGASSKSENVGSVERITSISRRISTVIRGYKFLSRSSANEPVTKILASQIVDSVVDLSSERLRKLSIELKVEVPDPNLMIECRPIAVSQVLLNLLNNAMDVVEKMDVAKRKIVVHMTSDSQTIYYSVTDPGHIDSKATKAKLFEPFFTTKPVGKGTGLGLSIAKQTIEQNHGKIYLDKNSATTRFVVELPASLPRPVPAAKVAEAAQIKILVVDDDVDFREILVGILKRQGYTVTEASSGNQAISLLQADPKIQIILSDCYMDDGNGRDLLVYVRKMNPKLPIFFLITAQSDFDPLEAKLIGAQEFFQKPINIPHLLEVIKSYAHECGGILNPSGKIE